MSVIPGAAQSASVPTRPGTLTAAIGTVVVTALAAIANGVIILTGGLDLVKELGNELVAAELGVSEAEVQETLDFLGTAVDDLYADAQSTFATRAYIVLVLGAAMLIFGLLMRKAAVAHRVMVTIAAALLVVFAGVILADAGTTAMHGLAIVAILGSIVSIVLSWLPANNRYAKAAK